jgi:hypothetical protein
MVDLRDEDDGTPLLKDRYIDSLDIHPSLLALLGRAVVFWAHIETLEAEFLAYLLGGDPDAIHGLAHHVRGSAMTECLRTLSAGRFISEASAARVDELLNRLESLRAELDAYVRGMWRAGPEPITATVRTVRPGRRDIREDELVTADGLKKLLEGVAKLHRDFTKLNEQLSFAPGSARG